MTQIVNGIHLPDRDKHFAEQIRKNSIVNGKGTYQYSKVINSLEKCEYLGFAIDIGANVGLWTRILADRFRTVSAIEPMPENLECLHSNTNEYGNVEIHPLAISKHIGLLSMKYMEGIASANVCMYDDKDIEVPCKKLDDFGFRDVDFIKVDAEGYEKTILESGEFTVKKYRPVITVEQKKGTVKYDGYKFAAVSLLSSWGMTVAWEDHGDICMIWSK
jgi:FkbM family methyltransferase